MKKLLTLIIILISVTINTVPAKASSYAEEWLKKKQAQQEKYMDELEADGNLTQEAIDSISKGTSTRKPSKQTTTSATEESKPITRKSSSKSSNNTGVGRGWVYGTDELHVVGLPTDERGYTKAGWYGDID